ncbi:MAG: aspartate aminotransferase family protein [Melioribacteraceae bacterium]|nr:aspartate aminotransferase family protein [Melioribacteraceae bacterium]
MSTTVNSALEVKSALLNTYNRFPVQFSHGSKSYLYDTDGNKYLDFLCGIAVTGFGHNHPQIKKEVENQIESFWHVSNLFESSEQEVLAEKLIKVSGLDEVFFCNSGTEANEAAIKFARKVQGERSTVISAIGAFHGRTYGSLTASAQSKLWEGFKPLLPGFKYVEFNNIESLENSITPDVGTVILEPIQGEGGIIVPSNGYLKEVEEICENHDLLLIFDEIQTGMGRTGKHFASQWFDVSPDIITVAKGIANGLPLGAVLCSDTVGKKIKPGDHGSTFGGNPVSIAAANAVMNLLDETTLSQIHSKGKILQQKLKGINSPFIKEIRGMGLMIGIEFTEDIKAADIVKSLLSKKIITCPAGKNTLRLLPPFIITEKEIDLFEKTFRGIIEDLHLKSE